MGVERFGTTEEVAQLSVNVCISLGSARLGTGLDRVGPALNS